MVLLTNFHFKEGFSITLLEVIVMQENKKSGKGEEEGNIFVSVSCIYDRNCRESSVSSKS